MFIRTVGILSPGEMGHNIAIVLRKHGLHVVTCLKNRSQRTQKLASLVGISNLPDLEELVRSSDVILSVVVPSAALEVGKSVARAISTTGRQVLFADANAISPMTSITIGKAIASAGGKYVDMSITGSARNLEKGAIFYASGEHAKELSDLQNYGLHLQILGEQIGQASAFKIIYAGLTKGLSSLTVELLISARAMGILDQVLEKYQKSYPEISKFMVQILPGLPLRAARRSQEMEELTDTLQHYGIRPVMAPASGKILDSIGKLNLSSKYSYEDEKQWTLKDVIEMLYQGLKEIPADK